MAAALGDDDRHHECVELFTGLHLARRRLLVPGTVVAGLQRFLIDAHELLGVHDDSPLTTVTTPEHQDLVDLLQHSITECG